MYTDEFPCSARTYARSVSSNESVESKKSLDLFSTAPVSPDLPPQHIEFEKNIILGETSAANVSLGPNPILVGKVLGRQEVRLTLKQVDSMPGPKVDIELNLNSCTYFFTPRQVHILVELVTGLSFPDMEDNSNVAPTRTSRNKPMEAVDFVRVEEELQKQMHPQHVGKSLEHHQGWSSHCLDDSDDDFLPMTSHQMASSVESENTALSDSTGNDTGQTSCSSAQAVLSDPGSELTHYKVQLSSINIFILHDDILTAVAENGGFVAQSSIQQMKNMTGQFFADMTNLAMANGASKDFAANRQKFAEICKVNHLRLSAAPVTIEGNQRTVSSLCTFQMNVSCGTMEFVECLIDEKPLGDNNRAQRVSAEYCDLVVFNKNPEIFSGPSTQPSLRLKFTHIEQTKGLRNNHRLSLPKTDLQINLEPCQTEIDISIVDRISALLNPQRIYRQSQSGPTLYPQSEQAVFNQVMDEGDSSVDYRINVKITAPMLTIRVRFPIPDLRALHDMDRLPWWKRNVRPDILKLQFTSTVWSTVLTSKESSTAVELRWKDAHGYYQKSDNEQPVHFLRATSHNPDASGAVDGDFNCPRLQLKINPLKPPLIVEEEPEESLDSLPLSSIDTLVYQLSNNKKTDPSPFSSRKVVYENQHNRSDKNEHKDPFSDKDQMVMPGDKAEMALFMETTTSNCRLHFDFNLPNLTVFLPSKDFYEILYNRISNDLFLWEPTAPKPRMFDANGLYMPSLDLNSSLMNKTTFHAFSPKPGIDSDSNSNSEDEEDHIYYSVYEQRSKQRKYENPRQIGQNKVAVTLASNKAKLTIYTPCKEVIIGHEKIIPGHCGEIHLQIEEGLCYILCGFRGHRDVSFVCLQVNNGAVFHNGMQPYPLEYPPLQKITQSCVSHLFPTMYHSEPGMYTKLSGTVGTGADSLDMLTMAVKVHLDTNTHIKTFKVALGIREATIRYRVTPSLQSCVEQFADFFDVCDQFVPGYREPDIVTELHLHLWGCGLDYRPIYLPMRAVLTVECLSISSNITAHTSISLLRFIAEDLSLFISKNTSATQVDLKKDYVGVIDINFCDLSEQYVSTKMEEKSPLSPHNMAKELGIPYKDMRASFGTFNIRTCSDSLCALQDLIAYCLNYGDTVKNDDTKSESSEASQITEESLKSQEEVVHSLMAEAMKESVLPQNSQGASSSFRQDGAVTDGGEVFLFPDEAVHRSSGDEVAVCGHFHDPSAILLPEDEKSGDSSGDDGFFILEDDPGVGFMPKSGEPEVRVLVDEPIRLVENYFTVPITKTDQLKAPKSFPIPEERYILQEMTFVWQIYAGNDFSPCGAFKLKGKENRVKLADDCDGIETCDYSTVGVSFSVNSPHTVNWMGNGNTLMNSSPAHYSSKNWKTQGGPGRRHNVVMELQLNKVRFQYEKYPANAPQAVWQILLIHEVEIRDRLESSQINKFLYQYSSEAVPRQTHANMVVVKAVHSRPDPLVPAQECSVKVSILPIRLNIDQDALLFLYNFFSEVSSRSGSSQASGERRMSMQAPVMAVQSPSGLSPGEREELLIALDNTQELVDDLVGPFQDGQEACSADTPVFFSSFLFSPEVPIRLDYTGKHVDMEKGTLAGIIMGLGQLSCSEIRLKRLCYRHGLLGVERLLQYAICEWIQDIKKNQLPGLLGGVGPMHSLVQLVQGIRDLFWLPVEQYKKDGRIVRGLQRGANSFTTSTAMAVLELTNRLVQTIQCAAETAYDMVSPGPSVKKNRAIKSNRRKKPSQPADIREGMASAYQVVREGFSDTARIIVNAASEEHRHKGFPGAVGGVLRQIPPTVVKPIIIASEATSNVLGGMRHQLQPDVRREAAEKWR